MQSTLHGNFARSECHANIHLCYYVRLRAKCVAFSSLLCMYNVAAAIHVVIRSKHERERERERENESMN